MRARTPLILLLVGIVAVSTADSCDENSECAADQCCQKLRAHPIYSRRSLAILKGRCEVKDGGWNARCPGRCAPYIKEGQSCAGLFNGECRCAPGLKCVFHPVQPLEKDHLGKRSLRPGRSICEKE